MWFISWFDNVRITITYIREYHTIIQNLAEYCSHHILSRHWWFLDEETKVLRMQESIVPFKHVTQTWMIPGRGEMKRGPKERVGEVGRSFLQGWWVLRKWSELKEGMQYGDPIVRDSRASNEHIKTCANSASHDIFSISSHSRFSFNNCLSGIAGCDGCMWLLF